MVNEAINNLKSDRENTMLAKILFKVAVRTKSPKLFTERSVFRGPSKITHVY